MEPPDGDQRSGLHGRVLKKPKSYQSSGNEKRTRAENEQTINGCSADDPPDHHIQAEETEKIHPAQGKEGKTSADNRSCNRPEVALLAFIFPGCQEPKPDKESLEGMVIQRKKMKGSPGKTQGKAPQGSKEDKTPGGRAAPYFNNPNQTQKSPEEGRENPRHSSSRNSHLRKQDVREMNETKEDTQKHRWDRDLKTFGEAGILIKFQLMSLKNGLIQPAQVQENVRIASEGASRHGGKLGLERGKAPYQSQQPEYKAGKKGLQTVRLSHLKLNNIRLSLTFFAHFAEGNKASSIFLSFRRGPIKIRSNPLEEEKASVRKII